MKNPNTFKHKNGITIDVVRKELDSDRVAAFIIAFTRWHIQQDKATTPKDPQA